MNARLKSLSDAGVSIWLDDLSRERLATGNLQTMVDENSVVGVTTNPTIFAAALANGERYAEQVGQLKAAGADVDELKVHEIYVDKGPVLKRIMPRAKGRADRILKPTSHITIKVSDGKAA